MNKQKGAWFMGWLVTRKGSDTSGNYGHKGVKGRRGGSAPGGGHMAIGIPSDISPAGVRYRIAKYRKEQAAKKKAGKTTLPTGTAPGYSENIENMDVVALDRIINGYLPYGAKDDVKEMAGLESRDPIDSIVGTWASTSNDTNLTALSFQQAVSEEFGIPLSNWQENQLKFSKEPSVSGLTPAQRGQSPIADRATERRIARAMYERTQSDLASVGYKPGDKVKVFRGVYSSQGNAGDQIDLAQNTISSWSLKPGIASKFAKDNRPNGIILAMEVPVESIFSTARTGIGTSYESELVLFGVPGNQATVAERFGPYYD